MLKSLKLKIIYYIIILIIFTIYIVVRHQQFFLAELKPVDIAIGIIWLALLLTPFCVEIDIFGIKLKNDFNSFKNEIKDQLFEIKSEINTSASSQSQINQQIYIAHQMPDSVVPKIEKRVRDAIKQQSALENKNPVGPEVPSVPAEIQYLMNTRFNIEKLIREIWDFFGDSNQRHAPTTFVVRGLVTAEVIDNEFAKAIIDVYRACVPATHGENVSDTVFNFVQAVAPDLISTLKGISSNFVTDDHIGQENK
jgi:hypothetical protein